MSDLKPCPFCGSEIEFIPSHVEEQNFVNSASIICRKCRKEYVGATFIVPGEIESEELTNNILINWWNTRPAEDAKDKEIERLKAALNEVLNIQSENYGSGTSTHLKLLLWASKYRTRNKEWGIETGKDTNTPANTPDTGKIVREETNELLQ